MSYPRILRLLVNNRAAKSAWVGIAALGRLQRSMTLSHILEQHAQAFVPYEGAEECGRVPQVVGDQAQLSTSSEALRRDEFRSAISQAD